jgi:hypothetical protein
MASDRIFTHDESEAQLLGCRSLPEYSFEHLAQKSAAFRGLASRCAPFNPIAQQARIEGEAIELHMATLSSVAGRL